MMAYGERGRSERLWNIFAFNSLINPHSQVNLNNHTKEKHFFDWKNKQAGVIKGHVWLPNQWESKNTVLSRSLKNHTYPGDSYLKCWLYQLFFLFEHTLSSLCQAEIVANDSYNTNWT